MSAAIRRPLLNGDVAERAIENRAIGFVVDAAVFPEHARIRIRLPPGTVGQMRAGSRPARHGRVDLEIADRHDRVRRIFGPRREGNLPARYIC